MTKKLVIAEKPSVGMSIAAVLGVKDRKDGYIEGRDYLVSWGFGHLAELANADTYDEKYAKWRYDDLPIIPANWKYKIPRDKYSQFETLKKLMNKSYIKIADIVYSGTVLTRSYETLVDRDTYMASLVKSNQVSLPGLMKQLIEQETDPEVLDSLISLIHDRQEALKQA